MANDPRVAPERRRLGFAEAVRAAFGFLETAYGFTCVLAQPTHVRYETPHVFLHVSHEPYSHELDRAFGLRGSERDPVAQPRRGAAYRLGDVLRMVDAPEFRKAYFQPINREQVAAMVPQLADLVRRYMDPFLRGDPVAYARLEEATRKASAEYSRRLKAELETMGDEQTRRRRWQQWRIDRTRELAEQAWDAGNYRRVTSEYRFLRDELGRPLTPDELHRLEFAQGHLQGDTGSPS